MSSREAQAPGGGIDEKQPPQAQPPPRPQEDEDEEEWSGAFDPFADPEERRVLFASLDSFRQYRRSAHRNVTHRRRQSFYALPSLHWQTLAAPPFSVLETFDKVDAAIDANAEVAEAILDSALDAFQLPRNPLAQAQVQAKALVRARDVNWHDTATSSDVSKANSAIRQLYRDWSAAGAEERETCYGPVMRDLQAEFGEQPAPGTRLLIPGAGLGRLVFDTAMAGFEAEGNEISYHQLVTSSWVLNRTQRKEECAVYPFVLHFSNLRTREQQFKKVLIPDVHPGSAVKGYENDKKEMTKMRGSMSMTAADFLLLYNEDANRDAFHAVATVFFIDTAPNLIRYIQTVHHCLRPGGIWTNVGPLLWHFEDRPAPSAAGRGVDAAASAHAPGDDDLEKEYEHSHSHGHGHGHGHGQGGQGEGIGDPGVVELSQDEVLALIETMGFTVEKTEADIGGCGYIQDPDSMLLNMYRPVHWNKRKSGEKQRNTNTAISSTTSTSASTLPLLALFLLSRSSAICPPSALAVALRSINVLIQRGGAVEPITTTTTAGRTPPPAAQPRCSLSPKDRTLAPACSLSHSRPSASSLLCRPSPDRQPEDPSLPVAPSPGLFLALPCPVPPVSSPPSFGFGTKRKSGSSLAPTTTSTNTPNGSPSQPSPPPGTSSAQNPNASSASLPMNPQNHLGRPPSYTYAPGAGRPASPLPPGQHHPHGQQLAHHPPPLNTGVGVPYPTGGMTSAPPPPGYGGYPPQSTGGQQGHGIPQPLAPFRGHTGELDNQARSKAQLIVGIDFGTTFSGVAYAFATNTEAREDIITEWPGAGTHTKQKIPTVLYYDQYQKVVGWGPDIADALAPTGYPKAGVQKVEWFKLQLMSSGGNTYIDPINLPPLPPGKSEIDVAADYLFHLRGAMRNQLQKTLGEVFNREERNIRYFLTVPAIWNDAGKAATRAAAIQAGFLRDENDNRLTLITEPEAAAMFCAKTGLLNLKIHDAILIVDCGGGTVDLIAYEVDEETPFSVCECTAGSGDSCGSTALNRNFSNILRAKIRKMKLPDGSRTAGKVYAKCIMDFENRIKADFRNNGQKWAVDVGIEADFPEAGIEEGYMTFTNEEILQCFEPVVNRILELVRNQIIAIQAQNRPLQNVLVVGGFGASEYLFQQIKLHVPPQYQSKVVRPMDSVAAIVKGAVTAGITERVVTSRVARRHYLMATLQPFKEGHHPEQYRVPSLDGKDRCKYTRQIFVQKGERIKNGEPVKVSFFRQVAPGATLMYEDILYACDEDVCPEYTKDPRIKEVVTLTSDLSRKNLEKDFERMDTPQGTFYRVYFDIYLTLDGSEFNAELVCQGEVMGRCSARFR
ncbi:uncharacterized protein GIQ15_04002 [Arthroderma uncinatum]|uniref:uncharacterized protein n=1 Tax=Arthroderma uncinatum TaxID=74035 RepID=UPI00144AE06C|nr:uncharacterized protein GIQ15_04002 [Arthroderma uncinatum]KAF3481243.1 hypothetical protein GIQ15_04002 [Arthroderma uncinatum]